MPKVIIFAGANGSGKTTLAHSAEWGIVLNNEYEYKNIAMGKKESYNIVNEAEFDKFKEALRHDKR